MNKAINVQYPIHFISWSLYDKLMTMHVQCVKFVIVKHNTYSRVESFDGITSIGENLSKTEKYKGTILIRVFI